MCTAVDKEGYEWDVLLLQIDIQEEKKLRRTGP
jgi:hypothetical protein